MNSLPTVQPAFPSRADHNDLKKLRQEVGIEGLDRTARDHYHAYDYGWRRVVLDDYAMTSPIDREGKYFVGVFADQAEAMWRVEFNRPKEDKAPSGQLPLRKPRPHFEPPANASPEQIERWEYEQRELAKLRPAAEAEEAAGIMNGPAGVAYVELVIRFIHENLPKFAERGRATFIDPVTQAQAEMGVTATESDETSWKLRLTNFDPNNLPPGMCATPVEVAAATEITFPAKKETA